MTAQEHADLYASVLFAASRMRISRVAGAISVVSFLVGAVATILSQHWWLGFFFLLVWALGGLVGSLSAVMLVRTAWCCAACGGFLPEATPVCLSSTDGAHEAEQSL